MEGAVNYYAETDKGPILALLAHFKRDKDYIYPTMFFGPVPEIPKYRDLIRVLQLASFACLPFGFTYPVLWLVFVPFMASNLYIHYQVKQSSRLHVSGVYHPLIDEPVANDLELTTSGMLVTGSNMSGNSTFIKTLNINALCAQTLNTAFARDYASHTWRIASSMNTCDQLADGSSYYLEEVERINSLLEFSAEASTPYLITIDEVFRGTNTVERISNAKAVLDYLANSGSLVLVSTHDLELADLFLYSTKTSSTNSQQGSPGAGCHTGFTF